MEPVDVLGLLSTTLVLYVAQLHPVAQLSVCGGPESGFPSVSTFSVASYGAPLRVANP